MQTATLNSLSKSERDLVIATEPSNLQTLDEDALIALHERVRRARNKYVQLHRREVGEQVGVKGARGMASVPPRRSASKAEVFEGVLARVSSALARKARQSAAELRADRLAAARGASGSARHTATRGTTEGRASAKGVGARSRGRRPVERKTVAAAQADGARRQAKGDARRATR
jgi:hypothetical protein